MMGVYEYCGIQRCGKSTLMMADMVSKLLGEYRGDDIFCNFKVYIPGVRCMENMELIEEVMRWKREDVRHKIIMFDEVGQELKARSYMDKLQSDFVNFAWQMPKRDILLMYCSNPGNSADIILRKAAWQTLIPHYVHCENRVDEYILVSVIFNWEVRCLTGLKVKGVWTVQSLFNSYEAIS